MLLLSVCLTACIDPIEPASDSTRQATQSVAYGEDDRLEVYEHPNALMRAISETSIVALVDPDRVDASDPENIQFNTEFLGESLDLCQGERFVEQPRIGSCSGTLIDDDLVLTAGHCMPSAERCAERFAIFGVHYVDEGQLRTITEDHVYSCERIIVTVDDGDLDFAIFQLDRPVVAPFAPVEVIREDTPLPEDTDVTLIGFPTGIPAKIASNGRVTRPREDTLDFFEATVDAFGGNSGSGVFNEDGQHVGILVRGEQDYRSEGNCTVVNVIEGTEAGDNAEDITYSYRAIEALCSQNYPSERLCQTDGDRGWCFPCEEDSNCREGWTCARWDDNPDVSFCTPPCSDDSACREDHTCSENGVCEPRIEEVCAQGQPWRRDTCGRLVSNPSLCSEEERCVDAECEIRSEGDICSSAFLIDAVDQTIEGELSDAFTNDTRGSCAGAGPEVFYTFTLEEPTYLRANAEGFDSVLYIRADCEDSSTQVACNDDPDRDTRAAFLALELEAGTWTIAVDSYNERVSEYTLQLDFGPTCEEYPCLAGDVECEDGETRRCTEDAQECPVWTPWEPCVDEKACIQNMCVDRADGDTCENQIVIEPRNQFLDGVLSDRTHRNTRVGTCGGVGPDVIHSFFLEQPTRFSATAFGFDTLLYLRADCTDPGTEIACNDDNEPPGFRGSQIEANLSPGNWSLILDAFDDDEGGAWSVNVNFEALCEDPCDEDDALRCGESGPESCVRDEDDGCRTWAPLDPCGDEERCVEGACAPLCEDPCPEDGARECVGEQNTRTCSIDETTACLVWQDSVPCPENQLCMEGGVCAAAPQGDTGTSDAGADTMNSDVTEADTRESDASSGEDTAPPDAADDLGTSAPPEDVVGELRGGGGCTQTPRNTPLPALWLMLSLGVALVVRRRRETPPQTPYA